MINSKAQLIQNGSSVASASTEATGRNVYRYSGRIVDALSHSDIDGERVAQVSVASREGQVLVELIYKDISQQSWVVKPNAPLIVSSSDTLSLQAVYIRPLVNGELTLPGQNKIPSTVEILIESGTTEINPADGPFLILNARQGVELNKFTGELESWKDVRPESGAPAKFVNQNTETVFTAEDPAFNGQPSLNTKVRDSNNKALLYTGGSSVWNFFDSRASFTLMTICNPKDDGTGKRIMGDSRDGYNDGPFTALIEGGFRPSCFFEASYGSPWGGSGATVTTGGGAGISPDRQGTLVQKEELHEKASIIIYDYEFNGATGTLRVYYQGRWQTLAATLTPTSFSNFAPYVWTESNIADLRLYDRNATAEEINSYINGIGIGVYGIDDTEELGSPLNTGASSFQRMNRGVFPLNSSIVGKTGVSVIQDTRLERTIAPATGLTFNYPTTDDPNADPPLDSLAKRYYPEQVQDGVRTSENTFFQYTTPPAAFISLSGLGGVSINLVFQWKSTNTWVANGQSSSNNYEALFSCGERYLPSGGPTGASGAGTNILIAPNKKLYIETDNPGSSFGGDGTEVATTLTDFKIELGILYALSYRINAAGDQYSVDLLNVKSGQRFSFSNQTENAPTASSAVIEPSFGGRNAFGTQDSLRSMSCDAVYYEVAVTNGFINLESFEEYVIDRYA